MSSATFRGSALRGPEANDPWLPRYRNLVVYAGMAIHGEMYRRGACVLVGE